jgi:uncharacterized protein (TIGR02117 family)
MKGRVAITVALALAAPPLAYLLAAAALGVIAVNGDFRPAPGGVTIYLRTNGIHADLVLPTRTTVHDWSREFPATHMRALAQPAPWIAFGWGDREFMVATPTWRDLRAGTALRALSGLGSGALHVQYVADPAHYEAVRIQIGTAQYERLVAYVRAALARDGAGRPRPIEGAAYADHDRFYEAGPAWRFWFTCNEWTRRALAAAGVRTAFWAPFPWPLFWQLERAAAGG